MSAAWQEMSPGQEIRAYRRLKGISQSELARRAGVNKGTIVRIEQNENIRLDTLERVREALFGKPPATTSEERIIRAFSDDERRVVEIFRALSDDEREQILRGDRRLTEGLAGTSVPAETARAGDKTAIEKIDPTLSSSGTSYAIQAPLAPQGGSPHGDQRETSGPARRQTKSDTLSDAEVRRQILAKYDELNEALAVIRKNADGLQTVVDLLRPDSATPDSRTTESSHAGRRAPIRARGTKSRRRA